MCACSRYPTWRHVNVTLNDTFVLAVNNCLQSPLSERTRMASPPSPVRTAAHSASACNWDRFQLQFAPASADSHNHCVQPYITKGLMIHQPRREVLEVAVVKLFAGRVRVGVGRLMPTSSQHLQT